MWAGGALAEGRGIRAVARGFEGDAKTVLRWVVEAAAHRQACSQDFLHDVCGTQLQLDELYALLRAVKAREISEAEAITRLSRSPYGVWGAIDPVTTLLLAIEVGDLPLALAQSFGHQVARGLASGWVPVFPTDGFKEDPTALLARVGHGVPPERRQAKGPMPQPRWMPLPQRRYAQVIKVTRRRRLVEGNRRVVFGTKAAVGRRVMTLGKGEAGVRQPRTLDHGYSNFCWPHASVRPLRPPPEPTPGHGSAKRGPRRMPAMAAGLTDHGWTLREVRLFRVLPWPQPQTVEAADEEDHRGVEGARGARREAKRVERGPETSIGVHARLLHDTKRVCDRSI